MINMNDYQLLIIGGSTGSVEVLLDFIPGLPENFPLPVIIVVHRKANEQNLLSDILDKRANLKVKEADEKEKIEAGTVYVAPGDYHLLIEKDKSFSLDYSEKIAHSRPSIDLTFMQAAKVYQDKVIGILLTGANEDGAEGLKAIADNGGFTMVQDPAEAEVKIMPQAACKLFKPNLLIKLDQLFNLFEAPNIT